LGGPGSGKGTQSEMLAHDFRLTHLSAGDLLREEVKSFSEIGKMAESLMKEGKIVPMDVILKLLERAIDSAPDSSRGILIDGFPRALDQAIEFEKTIARAGAIVNFTCPLDVLEQRLLKRGETSGRADDNIETIRKRFDTFQRESLPVLDYFGSRVIHIDGSKSVEDVYDVFSDAILASEIFEPEMNVIFAVGEWRLCQVTFSLNVICVFR
ncbi:adenylate kinase-domain-containing protein, partial [Chytriomyces sp. MP71]